MISQSGLGGYKGEGNLSISLDLPETTTLNISRSGLGGYKGEGNHFISLDLPEMTISNDLPIKIGRI